MFRDVTNGDVQQLPLGNPGKLPEKKMQMAEPDQNDTERGKTILAKIPGVVLSGVSQSLGHATEFIICIRSCHGCMCIWALSRCEWPPGQLLFACETEANRHTN